VNLARKLGPERVRAVIPVLRELRAMLEARSAE
jgi:hypothetical protein